MEGSYKVYRGFISSDVEYGEGYPLFITGYDRPIAEIFYDDFYGKQVTVRYWLSDKEKSIEEIKKNYLFSIIGGVNADYGEVYSEYTGYLWTDEEINIGGHNLLGELMNNEGKFIHLEIEVFEKQKE